MAMANVTTFCTAWWPRLRHVLTELVGDWSEPYGLVAMGGDLEPERLLRAYRSGCFPWYDDEMPICWWSPDPRAIFDLETFRPTRRLARTYRSGRFKLTVNQAFADVMAGCADRPDEGTWITHDMRVAYERLHALGYAHSIEAWADDELVGGIYGVSIGGLFAGESMFYRCRDASKVCLVHLVEHLCERGYSLFDTQFLTPHTANMGAVEISREEYLRRLAFALEQDVIFVDSKPSVLQEIDFWDCPGS